MWSEDLAIAKVLFNIQIDVIEYQFTQGMWFGESNMTKVLFDIQQIVERMTNNMINQKYGKDYFY